MKFIPINLSNPTAILAWEWYIWLKWGFISLEQRNKIEGYNENYALALLEGSH